MEHKCTGAGIGLVDTGVKQIYAQIKIINMKIK